MMPRKINKRKAIQAEKRKAAAKAKPKVLAAIPAHRPMAATLAVMMAELNLGKDQTHE